MSYNKLSRRVLNQNISIATTGKDTEITYFAPIHVNDRKRIGTELSIRVGRAMITLDGHGKRALEAALKKIRKQERALVDAY